MIDKILEFCNEYEYMFGIASSIATTIAVLIGLYTIIEVKKQRESSYRPELILQEHNFTLDKKKFPYIHHFNDTNLDDIDRDSLFGSYNFNLTCINIGFASAKNVTVNFKVDVNKYLKIINQYNESIADEIKPFDVVYQNSYINLTSQKKLCGHTLLSTGNDDVKLNYILPINIDNNPTNIYIPAYILYLNILLQYYNWNHHIEDKFENLDFSVLIKYKDIGNKNHKTKFDVILKPYSLMADSCDFKLIIK